MNELQINGLSLAYGEKTLLSQLNLSIAQGQWVAILGRSGCGKSTLLKAIAKLNHGATQHGEILCPHRPAYMAQQDALLPWLSVGKNIQLENRLNSTVIPETAQKAKKLLEQVGLTGHFDKAPYELSGGQRQRVALARTLMQSAEIILMDEPFSAVDAITRLELQQLSAQLLAEKTVILITHDPVEAIRLADVIYVMRDGELSQAYYPNHPRPRFDPELSQPELQQQLLGELR